MSLSFRIVFFIIAFLIMHLHAAQYVLSPSDDWFSIVTGAGLQPGDEVILTSGVYTSLNSINIGHQGTEQNPIGRV
ncbi:MAG: hypothetical protein HUU50_21965 [Candidatus Brocadiae bacterium]|nr:hypothetical protein [Candidatus Brocadiia bacterium]